MNGGSSYVMLSTMKPVSAPITHSEIVVFGHINVFFYTSNTSSNRHQETVKQVDDNANNYDVPSLNKVAGTGGDIPPIAIEAELLDETVINRDDNVDSIIASVKHESDFGLGESLSNRSNTPANVFMVGNLPQGHWTRRPPLQQM
jgi:hypothetical protein